MTEHEWFLLLYVEHHSKLADMFLTMGDDDLMNFVIKQRIDEENQ